MSYDLKRSHFSLILEKEVVTGQEINEEGVLLVALLAAATGTEKVQASTGTGADVVAGFAANGYGLNDIVEAFEGNVNGLFRSKAQLVELVGALIDLGYTPLEIAQSLADKDYSDEKIANVMLDLGLPAGEIIEVLDALDYSDSDATCIGRQLYHWPLW